MSIQDPRQHSKLADGGYDTIHGTAARIGHDDDPMPSTMNVEEGVSPVDRALRNLGAECDMLAKAVAFVTERLRPVTATRPTDALVEEDVRAEAMPGSSDTTERLTHLVRCVRIERRNLELLMAAVEI